MDIDARSFMFTSSYLPPTEEQSIEEFLFELENEFHLALEGVFSHLRESEIGLLQEDPSTFSPASFQPLFESLLHLANLVQGQRESIRVAWTTSTGGGSALVARLAASSHEVRTGAALAQMGREVQLGWVLRAYFTSCLQRVSEGVLGGAGGSDDMEGPTFAVSSEAEELRAMQVIESDWALALRENYRALQFLRLGPALEQACSEAVTRHLGAEVSRDAVAEAQDAVLEGLRSTLLAAVHVFFKCLPLEPAVRDQWASRADFLLYLLVGRLRIGQLFDLAADYPDSLPALEDLRSCLERTNLQGELAAAFQRSLEARLLIPGAETATILDQYLNVHRSLLAVDPTGLLLSLVDRPIKAYLKERRRDTIRCIVGMVTEGAEGEGEGGRPLSLLLEEPAPDPTTFKGEQEGLWFDQDDAAIAAAQHWDPEPAEARPLLQQGSSLAGAGAGDLLSMLVGIYGTKELFVKEYRTLLADRLLSRAGYDVDREIRTMELLKLRFGEASLHVCEVMLKDMADSRRVNAGVHQLGHDTAIGRLLPLSKLDATIMSHLFWPPQNEFGSFRLPRGIQETLEAYSDRFYRIKAPRRLKWRQCLGAVELSIKVGPSTLDLTVTPIQATLLMLFTGKARREWAVADLARETGLSVPETRRQMAFWLRQGVVHEAAGHPGIYVRCEDGLATGAHGGPEEAQGQAGPSEAEQKLLVVYENFILGMLTNFPSLPLSRIHNTLKMFMTNPPYDRSDRELAQLLQGMIAADKLVLEGDQYKKKKPTA